VMGANKWFNIFSSEVEWVTPSYLSTYGEAAQKDIGNTIRDLYDELENIPIGSEV